MGIVALVQDIEWNICAIGKTKEYQLVKCFLFPEEAEGDQRLKNIKR
jgi:hypothetical protein